MSAEDNLRAIGLVLPPPPPAAGTYVGGVRSGNLPRMSGCGPRLPDGTYIRGKLGSDLTVEVFGENGLGARTAVGIGSLTKGIAIEVLATWELAE